MAPVASRMAQVSAPAAARVDLGAPLKGDSVQALFDAWTAAKVPLVEFLARNAGERERDLFLRLSRRDGAESTRQDLMVVLPAFLITELKEAFQVGFFVLLPFLVIDLVVSNILLSLGMFLLSPSSVSLPFKLLLFVLVDGFYVLSEALIASYA
jgi:type III secretion protein R